MKSRESSNQITNYALGHAPAEIIRLVDQATILRPITARLLKNAGICPGMRILDVGCGAGDVTLLAAQFVGSSGSVIGIDRSAAAIEFASTRAASQGNVIFKVASPEELSEHERFDMVVGRYVLIFQEHPEAFLRVCARLASSNGTIAFHEIDDADNFSAYPAVASWTRANDWVTTAFRHLFPSFDVPGRLVECFFRAGLATPNLMCEVVSGDGERSPIPWWLANAVRTLLPQIIERGWASADEVDVDNLEALLRTETIAAHSQLSGPRQVCAWVKLG